MKRIIACLLTGLLAVGMMAGCSKKLTPEEQAASEAAVLAQQLQEEETQTGLKRLISNNLTEYEQPFYDFVDSLQKGDAAAAAKALGVPNTFGDKLQSWVIVNNYETFQKAEMKSICLNSAKDGASAVLNIYMKSPKFLDAQKAVAKSLNFTKEMNGKVKFGDMFSLIDDGHIKVDEITCTLDDVGALQAEYKVGNIRQRKNGLALRLVGDTLPKEAVPVEDNIDLEDVYLYYFE